MIFSEDVDRPALRRALLAFAPWLTETEVGPAAVEAGDCDRCGNAPRLLPLCGPVPWQAVCRGCGLELEDDGWCAGHADDGARARDWAAALPSDWERAVLLWWLATGELRGIELLPDAPAALPAAIVHAIGR
ncbi:hypothetical protein [Egicoccus sp. AB-alg6-2]|uniref:hypothetical protein n=1 Tax=Egicoccus sp. AB-alg6-2 TaxID=3242692 RepID=UPI00359CF9DD